MTTGAGPSAGRQRLLRWSLVASLTANLFLVGLAVGYAAMHVPFGKEERRERSGMFLELRGYAGSLPPEQREAFREGLGQVMPELREKRARLRELRAEIAALVTAAEPDRAAIDERLEEVRALTNDMQAIVQRRAFDMLLALPDDIRRGLELEPKEQASRR